MKKLLWLTLTILILAPPAVLYGLLSSEAGSNWLLRRVLQAIPADSGFVSMQGNLLGTIRLNAFAYRTAGETVRIDQLTFSWYPRQLSAGRLHIAELSARGVSIERKPNPTPPDSSTRFDRNRSFAPPIAIKIDALSITDLQYRSGDSQFELPELKISAHTVQNRLHLEHLAVSGLRAGITASGELQLGQGFPFRLGIDWRYDDPKQGRFSGAGRLDGSIELINVHSRTAGPFVSSLHAQVSDLLNRPRIQAELDWQQLRWPFTEASGQLLSEQGRIGFSGYPDAYRLELNAEVHRTGLPKFQARLNANGSQSGLQLQTLSIRSPAGGLEASGRIDWRQGLAFLLDGEGRDFNPGLFDPRLPGQLNFSAHLQGTIRDNSRRLTAELKSLQGRLRDYPVAASGKLDLQNDALAVAQFDLSSGKNRIRADGNLDRQQSQLRLDVNASDLAGLWPGLRGRASGQARLSGDWQNPALTLQTQAEHIAYQANKVDKLDVNIDYAPDGKRLSHARAAAAGIVSGAHAVKQLNLEAEGSQKQHRIHAEAASPAATLALTLAGGLNQERWQGQITHLQISAVDFGRWHLKQAVKLAVSARAAATEPLCLQQGNAALCLSGKYRENHGSEFTGDATALPLALLQAFLPGRLSIDGELNAHATLQHKRQKFSGQIRAGLTDDTALRVKDAETGTEFTLKRAEFWGDTDGQRLNANLALHLNNNDSLLAHALIDPDDWRAVSGNLQASIADISPFNPFVPQLSRLAGRIDADLSADPQSGTPKLQGQLQLSQASFELPGLGIAPHDIQLSVTPSADDPERFALTGKLSSGPGRLKLDGWADLTGEANLHIKGQQFEAAKIPEAQIELSPNLTLARAPTGAKLAGTLSLDKAVLSLAEIPENAVAVSQDEVIAGAPAPTEPAAASVNLDTDLEVLLGKQSRFSGQGLSTDLHGRLVISKIADKNGVYGTVEMKNGRYRKYGQDLTVRTGRFLFNGPADNPWLDLEATRLSKSREVTAVLSLTGPLNSPKTKVYAEPALPEADALAYLITGSALDQVGKSDGNLIANAALSYGVGQLSWLPEKLGVDTFDLQQGKTLQDTLVSVGRYLTPDFYIGSKINLFSQQASLILKHKIGKNFSVETQTGSSQRVKFNWEVDTN